MKLKANDPALDRFVHKDADHCRVYKIRDNLYLSVESDGSCALQTAAHWLDGEYVGLHNNPNENKIAAIFRALGIEEVKDD
jgi:hypothetical protein